MELKAAQVLTGESLFSGKADAESTFKYLIWRHSLLFEVDLFAKCRFCCRLLGL